MGITWNNNDGGKATLSWFGCMVFLFIGLICLMATIVLCGLTINTIAPQDNYAPAGCVEVKDTSGKLRYYRCDPIKE